MRVVQLGDAIVLEGYVRSYAAKREAEEDAHRDRPSMRLINRLRIAPAA